ncbi:MAG: GNAT family N-acetyltransferase [Deltaproteobacteria bacterium]|nr:GNAT family N-acetyltransferase [Deltaproteobacteria bacterium]MBI3389502.1 GNAT family N-acetyltransferase [Deltaproteobacteria bacterium]
MIAPCRVKDIDAVLDLWKRAGAAPSVTDDGEGVRRRLKRDRQLFVLAWAGARLAGSLIGGWDGWRASMARLAVDPAYRRHGIAKRLVAAVEAQLRQMGAKRIGCIVLEGNEGGTAFWRAAGYWRDAQTRRYVKDLS